jgi:hypothetical protein
MEKKEHVDSIMQTRYFPSDNLPPPPRCTMGWLLLGSPFHVFFVFCFFTRVLLLLLLPVSYFLLSRKKIKKRFSKVLEEKVFFFFLLLFLFLFVLSSPGANTHLKHSRMVRIGNERCNCKFLETPYITSLLSHTHTHTDEWVGRKTTKS